MTRKKRPPSAGPISRPRPLMRPVNARSSAKDMFTRDQKSAFLIPQGELDLFHYMVDHIGDEVMVLDKDARIMFINEATVHGLGYAKNNLLQRHLTDFFEERISVRQWQKKYFLALKKRRGSISYTVNRVAKGGKVRTVNVTAVYMRYKFQDYILTVGRDITEQLAFQVKFKESEDRYRLLSEQAAEGILMVNLKGSIMYANAAAGEIFKANPSKIVGTYFGSYMDKSSVLRVLECFQKIKKGKPVICSDLNIRDGAGQVIPVEFTASPILRGSKTIQIHVIFRNISQRKEMESLVLESEKMKALQHFIAGTTHEIQQPLKGLLDRSQSLIDAYKDRSFEYIGFKEFRDILDTLRTMNDQVKYCYSTTERLLSISRRKAKIRESSCNVNLAIREAVNLLKHSMEVSGINLRLKLSSRLPHVAIGPLDLRQVLSNILTNAIQSLPGNEGAVFIKTIYQKASGRVRIDFQDEGVGIPKEILGRVFEPFFTTKSRGLEKNAGLGLSVVYSIIKAHQGEIFLKSKVRQGTLVTVLLPVYHSNGKRKR